MVDMKELNDLFIKKGRTLSCVESFTGGLFAKAITDIPGASHFFQGGMVTYSKDAKVRVLGIKYPTIDKYGVVSQEIAGEMCGHGRSIFATDYCVSFTGNAGPTALEGKPVGEIYIGVATWQNASVFKFNLQGSRDEIREQALMLAKNILMAFLNESK